ncbi:MAG: hypothetical protein NVSMB70_08500 [Chamaesiphon sp.]
MGGGPNAQQAIQLLPALVTLGNAPKITLCQVVQASESLSVTPVLDRAVRDLRRQIRLRVNVTQVRGSSVPEAVTSLAKAHGCDVVILGASREGLLQQVIQGNIPEAIARGCDCTVILVRGALTD